MSINKVIISGNLTRDPELRNGANGMNVLVFGIAANERRRDPSTGDWKDYPNFFDCTVFGNRADGLSRVLTKGMKVVLVGRLHYSTWEKDGAKRSKVEIYVDEVDFMSSRNAVGSGPEISSGSAEVEIPPAPDITVYDEDIPF